MNLAILSKKASIFRFSPLIYFILKNQTVKYYESQSCPEHSPEINIK